MDTLNAQATTPIWTSYRAIGSGGATLLPLAALLLVHTCAGRLHKLDAHHIAIAAAVATVP